MAQHDDPQRRSDRRGFLKLGLGSVAGGAAVAASGLTAGTASAAPAKSEGGYAETEHVRSYYDSARF